MNNPNFINNMNQIPNQINPLMNMNMIEQMNYFNLNKRIIELENIIKKKDKQIAKLKEKLDKSTSFDYIYSPNRDETDDEDEDEYKVYKDIELIISYIPPEKSDDKFIFREYCNFNEKIKSIKKRLFKKISEKFNVKFKNLKFLYNSCPLIDQITASECGLTNLCNMTITSIINVKGARKDNILEKKNEIHENSTIEDNEDKIGLTFMTTIGTSRNIFVNRDIPIGVVLIYYFLITRKFNEFIDLINGNIKISFIYKSYHLNIKDGKNVEEIFGNEKNPKIIVNDTNNLIGG